MPKPIKCCQSIIAFFAVISTGFFCFVVPILCVALIVTLAILSFWPLILASLPFLFLSFTLASTLLSLFIFIIWQFFRKQAVSRAFFLLPFHALFLAVVVSIFSFWWSIAVGAVLFVQGEVDFNTLTVNSRWHECVETFDRWSWPIFQYFPITVKREQDLRTAHSPQRLRRQVTGSGSSSNSTSTSTNTSTNNNYNTTSSNNNDNSSSNNNNNNNYNNTSSNNNDNTNNTNTTNNNTTGTGIKYLFCYHPHGMYAIGLFSLVFQHASGFSRLFPNRSGGMLVGVASALLHVPILGRLVSWFGFIPASRASLDAACRSQRDVAIVPGGIAEMTLVQHKGVEQLYLKARKGFIRLAIRHGRPLIPVYCFGETHIFHQYNCFQRTRQWLSRKLKISIVFFRGRNCTLVPNQVPLNVVVGLPIHVMQSDHPTEEYVAMIHAKYCQDLEVLFEKNKGDHPEYVDSRLKIV